MILQPLVGVGKPVTCNAVCESTDSIGDMVYISGDVLLSGQFQVTKVDINDVSNFLLKCSTIGMIVTKDSLDNCTIQVSGIVRNIYTGLTPGRYLFVGTDARLTHTSVLRPVTGYRSAQLGGVALASDVVLITLGNPVVLSSY
jgi:hypothetical protein